jgi:indolepyruvate ferredoxin oxidoreductase
VTEPEARRSGIAPDYQLSDRYTADGGTVVLTGLQALARLPIEQLRVDRAAGLNTAVFVSGYPGSPLGGYDQTIARAAREAPDLPVVCRPGVNEEYAATAVMGSQLAAAQPDARYDGVIGIWYGKAPGVDRASDALRHAVYAGSHPRGGAIALVGDDPNAKSSTLPSSSAGSLFDMHIPFLYPGDPGEALDLGRHAIALARCTGLWASLKIVADVADGSSTVTLDPARVQPTIPLYEGRPYVHVPDGRLLTPHTIELEREIYEVRYALAVEYASQNRLNHATVDPPDAWIGIVSSGITYREVREALRRLGLASDVAVADAGIRLLKLQMPMPFNPVTMRHFARGLRELLVIEEKHPNIESLVKDALYNQVERPLVIGKHDEHELPLIAGHGALAADDLLPALRRRLAPKLGERLAPDDAALPETREPIAVRRTPFYCSGCPHNRGTQVPAGTLVGAGIGCHTMTMLMNPQRVGDIAGLTCMGNEGTQWIGMADFVEREHFVQNLGDGTYFHSGQLAIQAAVAAGVSITYKLLWNGAVAMTGGQEAQGRIDVPTVARTLLGQGVARVLITADDPGRYDGLGLSELPLEVEVWPRERLLEAQQQLASVAGVTVLIHDQACAAELRRARKRGRAPTPAQRVAINPRICEGCGDCGRRSGCLSVQPLDTPFGRKTTIDQTTCNLDFSCLEGDCPSFMTVTPRPAWQRAVRRFLGLAGANATAEAASLVLPPALPDVRSGRQPSDFSLRITGVGGTGVVTVSQVLGTAAAFDGYEVRGLDQIGLSQKAGPVVSDLRLRRDAPAETNRLGRGQADLILAFDPLVAASQAGLDVADPERTAVVGSTHCAPTGAMITQPEIGLPSANELRERIAAVTRDGERYWADAATCTTALLGDAVTANLFVVGMAVEAGCLPIRSVSIERAIELNGVAIEANRAAFRWGRTAIANPERVASAVEAHTSHAVGPEPAARPAPLPTALLERVAAASAGDDRFSAQLALRVGDLVAYQDERLASQYLATVEATADREQSVLPGSSQLTQAVALSLHKLLAYKDEYEVARLMLDAEGQAPARALAGEDDRIAWRLHPPALRALGLRRKLRIGSWATPGIRLLAAGKRLRGTPLDPFGWPRIRRCERALPREYREAVEVLLAHLKPENLDEAASIASLPGDIRGYEELKLARIAEYRQHLAERLTAFGREVSAPLAGD